MDMAKLKYHTPQLTVMPVDVKGNICTLSQDDWADTNTRNNLDENAKEEINWDQQW